MHHARIGGARAVAIFVIALMIACGLNIALNDSFGHGSGMDTFNAGAGNPWQLFINMDLMSGLLLMLGWVLWRERGGSLLDTVAWAVLILWWGNIVVAAYILASLYQSRGNASGFFLGRRAGVDLRSPREIGVLRLLAIIGAIASAAYMIRGLISVQFTGISAFGYGAAFGTIAFGLAVFALARPRKISQ